MEQVHRQTIYFFLEELITQISNEQVFQSVLNYCNNYKMFNDWMMNEIRKTPNFSEQKRRFCEMLTKRGPQAYEIFLNALTEVGLISLVERIRRCERFVQSLNDLKNTIEKYEIKMEALPLNNKYLNDEINKLVDILRAMTLH